MQVFHMTAKQQEHKLAKLSLGMESSVAQPTAKPQHFPTAPVQTTSLVGEIFLQLFCATNKFVSDIFPGKAAPGVILKSLEELLKAAVNSKKELRRCHCWSLKSYTLWTNLGLFVLGLPCVTCQSVLSSPLWKSGMLSPSLFNYTMKMVCCKNCALLCTRLGLREIFSYLLCTVVERTNWIGS